MADDPDLINCLNAVVDKEGIDLIYPAHDSACLRLTMDQEKLHCKVVTSEKATVFVCRDKMRTYQYLSGADYLPKVYMNPVDVEAFPVFVKPRIGQGSVGAAKIDDKHKLFETVRDGRDHVVCEYLPGLEYTVDCFTDRHGTLRYIGQRTRERIRAGIAVRSELVPADLRVLNMASDLNDRFKFTGAWFFQVKRDRLGEPKLMEVAPRIAGTMGLSRNIGVNLPLLTIYAVMGEDVEIFTNQNRILLDRAFISRFQTDVDYDTVYVDFDDTLIHSGKINPFLMAFLYQTQNRGKKIILLTKHRGMIEEYIDPYMFNKIIHIRQDENKSNYIHGNAIFIDDSFAERKKVHEICGIPVYDLDMIESLFDWRA